MFGVEPICRVFGVPVSTHYGRRSRVPSARELADRDLVTEIQAARCGYRRAYGARKTWKELQRRDVEVGRDRVARVMRREGLVGYRRGARPRTTIPDETATELARDLLQRDFAATRPNEKWVVDFTYIRTWNGFVYLAFILDCYNRKIPAVASATSNGCHQVRLAWRRSFSQAAGAFRRASCFRLSCRSMSLPAASAGPGFLLRVIR